MKRPRQIVTDLTPLLDVILILLFLILSQTSRHTADVQSKLDQAKENLEQTQNSLEQAQNVISGLEEYDENTSVIIISIHREYTSDGEQRTLYVTDKESTRDISYDWDNLRYGENALKSELESCLKLAKEKVIFISFVYDSADIYRRDYELVISVLDKIQSTGESVYVSYRDTNERTE